MVKFGVNYESFIVSQWSQHYIDYEALKATLRRMDQSVDHSTDHSTEDNSSSRSSHNSHNSHDNNNKKSSRSTNRRERNLSSSDVNNSSVMKSLLDNDSLQADIEANLFRNFNLKDQDSSSPADGAMESLLDNESPDEIDIDTDLSSNPHILALNSIVSHHETLNPSLLLQPHPHFLKHLVSEITKAVSHHQKIQTSLRTTVLSLSQTSPSPPSLSKIHRYNLKLQLKSLYSSYNTLESFRSLNQTAALKILKKQTKNYPHLYPNSADSKDAVMSTLDSIWTSDDGKDKVVESYKNIFCKGDPREALMELRVPKRQPSPSFLLQLGFRLGVLLMTSTWLLWDLVVDSTSGKSGSIHVLEEPVTYVYSFCSSVILVYIGWGILKISWEGVGVNSDFIMEMDARKCNGGREILSAGAFWGSVFNGNFLMYYKLRRGVAGVLGRLIRPEIVPVGMVFITVGIIVMPWKRRRGLARGLKEVVKTPMGRVGFRENLIGDFLTSFVKVNVALAYSICYYASGDYKLDQSTLSTSSPANFPHCTSSSPWSLVTIPLISVLPLLWRLGQCVVRYSTTRSPWPHLANAGKYFFAFTVVIFGVFHDSWTKGNADGSAYRIVWIVFFGIATMYQWFWDVAMDWGIKKGRPVYLFPKFVYVSFVPMDLVLRFLWVLSLVPYDASSPFGSNIVTATAPFLAIAEVFRRLAWCLLRVENEHISNASNYRKVNFVPLEQFEGKEGEEGEEGERIMRRRLTLEIFGVLVLVGVVTSLAYFS
ncbi:hypothetical protein TrST_g9959 [Triparma strigata]|uniref:EXS domain-containing protein n=1 Tax=Triparma strigata TaxID=1606541 RepID=A0A9W7BCB2_9STRA|nr:hypothetical protein TrST_g9959 [Triparma strigata]